MIASFIDGRVRVRSKALKEAPVMQSMQEAVAAQDGILEVTVNLKTGSLLVRYDPKRISREQLAMAASILEEHEREGLDAASRNICAPGGKKRFRQRENALLGGLYLLTLLGGLTGTRVHVVSGALLTLLVGKHLYDRRRCL